MDALSQERALKRKLQNFLQELQNFGTLKGFKHFQCFVRSKEELVVSVSNTVQGNSLSCSGNLATTTSWKPSSYPSGSLSSSFLPNNKSSLVLSHNTQVGLSGVRNRGEGVPPAPRSEPKNTSDANATLLLVAGYARYSCPYVWVLSNSEQLPKVSDDIGHDRDSPLRLKSTAKWKDGDVLITDIIAEVVKLYTYPAPRNPFEINLQYFQSMSQSEQLLCSAALVACLQKIVVHTPDSKPYAAKVFEDLQYVTKFHFTRLSEMVTAANIPIMQQNSQQHQQQYQHQEQEKYQQQHKQQQQRRHSLHSRYPRLPATMPPIQAPVTSSPFNSSEIIYGQIFNGAFSGGFSRMPAPSIL